MSEAFRLENVSIAAKEGRAAVKSVSLTVSAGEHVLIKGPAGSGKLPLMRLIAGIDAPGDGKVSVPAKPVGVFLRESCLMPELSVLENTALPLAIRGVPARERRKAAMDALEQLGIRYAAHALPGSLNLYEAKLGMLAQAIAGRPKLLLLYEFTACLDESQARRLAALLESLGAWREAAAAVFASGAVPMRFARTFAMEYGTLREELT